VYAAWIDAKTAYNGISVSDELPASASDAFQLAQSQYQGGTSSIVELSQAGITVATGRFDYQVRRRALDYQMGMLGGADRGRGCASNGFFYHGFHLDGTAG
jgi:outer membrane protein TolC